MTPTTKGEKMRAIELFKELEGDFDAAVGTYENEPEIVAIFEHYLNAAFSAGEESMKEKLAVAREALWKICNISQFGREGGPIVMSEHYEASWLDCVEIAKSALQRMGEE